MKRLSVFAGIAAGLLLSALAFAASTKTYQVTGQVIDVNNDMIVVMKGNDRWEIMRDGTTKMPDNILKGDKVTITYRMHAESVEAKPAKSVKKKTS
jgi:hypothetical protein